MKNMLTKLLSGALFTILCIGIISFASVSAKTLTPSKGLDYAYTKNENGLIYGVNGIGSCTDKYVVIAATDPDGKKVERINTFAFRDCETVEEIYIEDGITDISSYAFENCPNLKKIRFPEGMTTVDSKIFGFFVQNSSLEEVELPTTVKRIEDNAFKDLKKLKSIKIPSGVEYIGNNAFENCSSLKKIVIPKAVRTIGEAAFSGCSSLSQVTLPANLKNIPDKLFVSCSSLKKIVIPKNVTKIGNAAFAYCGKLKTVKMYNKVKVLGDDVFSGCSSMTSLKLPGKLKKIGRNAFAGSGLKKLVIPASLTNIGAHAFASCHSLKYVDFKGSKSKIIDAGRYALSFSDRSLLAISDSLLVKFKGHELMISAEIDDSACVDMYLMGLISSKSLTKSEREDCKLIKTIAKKEMKISSKDSYYEKVKKVHDWLVLNTTYSLYRTYDLRGKGVSEYKIILKHHTGVCVNYAYAFKSFLAYLGVPCYYINNPDMEHAYNMVRMDDGKWYYVDVTWDDPTNNPNEGSKVSCYSLEYFLRDEAHFKDHEGAVMKLPKSKGGKYETNYPHTEAYIVK
ncbi:MAG: leucine-rich repeat protein [Lachnospiraceae bacterium]|nr:leucine-rich repeat protein [Lachnospiraceae bacterium]